MRPGTLETVRALTDNRNPMHLEGWCWMEKAVAMCELIEREKPALVVELGIFGGRSMLPQALQLKDNGHGVIFGMDPWTRPAALEGDHSAADAMWWAGINLDRIMSKFLGMIVNLGLIDVAIPIRATSHAAAPLFPLGVIDILHVDSNHSELVSMRELALYVPRVRARGYIWLDDLGWATNQAAVRELDSTCETIMDVKSDAGWCRLYRKP